MKTSYRPLRGVKVLDIGVLLPAALASGKLAALGADVVKVELPSRGDGIRQTPACDADGISSQHMSHNRGKRFIALDLRSADDRMIFLRLADRADVLIENQRPGHWAARGIDIAAMRAARPALVVCSITGFGQTGPLAQLPAHGFNIDAKADGLNLTWTDGVPKLGWSFCSWGGELAAHEAATAICAALLEVRSTGQGAWIDISCWDALVEAHRAELAMNARSGERFNSHGARHSPRYNTYLSRDGKPVLIGALELEFWTKFCHGVGRADLIAHHGGDGFELDREDIRLERELTEIFASADADEWDRRFLDWDCPGGTVLRIDEVMRTPHFAARGILEGASGAWPNVSSAIRWHHTGQRAGSGMAAPSEIDGDRDAVLQDWLDD